MRRLAELTFEANEEVKTNSEVIMSERFTVMLESITLIHNDIATLLNEQSQHDDHP